MDLNSWGARTTDMEKAARVIPISEHQVTTANVDTFKWKRGVEMYL